MNKEQENSVAERSRSYSNGKLLLTGEYVVLDGALALAVPTSYGQSLSVKPTADSKLHWKSYDDKNTIWHEALFEIKDHAILKPIQNDDSITKRLLQVLQAAKQLNPDFLNTGFSVENKLSFPRHWGLGTSSTLINNIAHWAQIDAYQLLHLTFGGSGYDIACAKHNLPITYQLQKPFDAGQEAQRLIKEVDFNPIFKDCLYFVYLNKKQNSREGIAHYKANALSIPEAVQNISALTLKMIACSTLNDFESLIDEHEQIISKLTKQTPVKHLLFSDFKGAVKSLGAWGGDFVLVTAKENPSAYFKAKGFDTVISYLELIL